MNIKKFVGDKKFYAMVIGIALPIIVQNGITNFVSLLDNIMVGRVGTEQMSAVAIVNQVMMIYFLCVFGGVAGAGIFTAQYYGQKNDEGVRSTMRIKFWIAGVITLVATLIMIFFGKNLIGLYLTGDEGTQDMAMTLKYAEEYLWITLIGLPPVVFLNTYASTLREAGETKLPMVAGIIAVLVNLCLNYILIYGKLGAPKLGVAGAAIATVIARYVEAGIVMLVAHRDTDRYTFLRGLYHTLLVPKDLTFKVIRTAFPLLLNETLWSLGVATQMQCYSLRGLDVVAAFNISNTIANLFNIIFVAMGDAVAILVGQQLGAGEIEKAKDTDRKIIAFAVTICFFIGALMAVTAAPYFPQVYNASYEVRHMATIFIIEASCYMPACACMHTTYFTLRSGGNTMITFLFDSVMMWCLGIPTAFILSHFTTMSIYMIYLCVMATDLFKIVLGLYLVKKGSWAKNIVSE